MVLFILYFIPFLITRYFILMVFPHLTLISHSLPEPLVTVSHNNVIYFLTIYKDKLYTNSLPFEAFQISITMASLTISNHLQQRTPFLHGGFKTSVSLFFPCSCLFVWLSYYCPSDGSQYFLFVRVVIWYQLICVRNVFYTLTKL